ncbi:MAG: 3-phosphoshikimate 1-carboxyvinyltransferase, partial [Firmicutes bacterium]|nr:3-phosphoshikimate 1-carboxyvinyltransferase [Bacillota bacterium]
AARAEGTSVIAGAQELRVKESDRIHAMAVNLTALGAVIEETTDGWIIEGQSHLHGGCVQTFQDHRIAMAMAVAAAAAEDGIELEGADAVAISYPTFFEEFFRQAHA